VSPELVRVDIPLVINSPDLDARIVAAIRAQ